MGTEVKTIPAVSFSQIERMAQAVAKSGMFAVKTPEGALTLMLIAQAEGCSPAQAMMDYDLIQGKPALKSAAMLARFQRAGGKVRWITSTDDVAEAEFTHPAGGSLTVKWDAARIAKAGLADRDMHKKFPAQMKRARCISEGIRAVAPQCIPVGLYAVEEVQDMVADEPGRVVSVQEAVTLSASALSQEVRTELEGTIKQAADLPSLTTAFSVAWERAKQATDKPAADAFKAVYDARKAELSKPVEVM